MWYSPRQFKARWCYVCFLHGSHRSCNSRLADIMFVSYTVPTGRCFLHDSHRWGHGEGQQQGTGHEIPMHWVSCTVSRTVAPATFIPRCKARDVSMVSRIVKMGRCIPRCTLHGVNRRHWEVYREVHAPLSKHADSERKAGYLQEHALEWEYGAADMMWATHICNRRQQQCACTDAHARARTNSLTHAHAHTCAQGPTKRTSHRMTSARVNK